MDMNTLTQKSQEALHDAQTKALRFGHTEADGEHLLLALLDQPDGLVPRLLSAAGVNPDQLRADLEAELARRPRVTGPGAAPGQVYITQRLARLLDAAQREANRLKDEYVSVEHLLLALLEEGTRTAAGRLLHAQALTMTLELTGEARSFIAQQGFDPVYGARPLRRFIAREVETRIGRALVAGDVRDGAVIRVGVTGGQITVTYQNPDHSDLQEPAMSAAAGS
jgi:ATP-dependent Clp protease ATP-binding subunit ClpB